MEQIGATQGASKRRLDNSFVVERLLSKKVLRMGAGQGQSEGFVLLLGILFGKNGLGRDENIVPFFN